MKTTRADCLTLLSGRAAWQKPAPPADSEPKRAPRRYRGINVSVANDLHGNFYENEMSAEDIAEAWKMCRLWWTG